MRDRLRDRESCCLSQDETTFAEHVRRRCRHFFGDSRLREVLRGSGKFYMMCRCICVVLSLFFCFIHCFAPLFRHHSHVCCRSIVSPQRACYRASERDIRPHALHVFCRSFVSPLRACKLSCHRDGHSTMTHVNFYSVGRINGPKK